MAVRPVGMGSAFELACFIICYLIIIALLAVPAIRICKKHRSFPMIAATITLAVIIIIGSFSSMANLCKWISLKCDHLRWQYRYQHIETPTPRQNFGTHQNGGGGSDGPFKPVIYLYNYNGEVTVALDYDGELTCAYPYSPDGTWEITARPDGMLVGENGMEYNYLYWEGKDDNTYDFSKGWCVKGSDTAEFLEEKLAELGLTRREANEFIVYWLPQMQNNPYNIITFQEERYTDYARLAVTPQPDTTIRIFMAYKPATSDVKIEPQELKTPQRTGKTIVEWGGEMITADDLTDDEIK